MRPFHGPKLREYLIEASNPQNQEHSSSFESLTLLQEHGQQYSEMATSFTQPLPADFFIKIHQFTSSVHRDEYPSIDPTSPRLSQHGKTVIVTGASQGVGKVNSLVP
jgi:hypothetical protein